MMTGIWLNIGTGNGLLPDNTKPLTNPMLINHQWGPMTFIWEQFPKRSSAISYYLENYLHQFSFKPPRDQWVNARWELQQATVAQEESQSDKCACVIPKNFWDMGSVHRFIWPWHTQSDGKSVSSCFEEDHRNQANPWCQESGVVYWIAILVHRELN